jgi:hypothetical protein
LASTFKALGSHNAVALSICPRDETGRIVLPSSHGNEIWGQAVALDPSSGYHPLSPEEAVSIVGTASGAKTVAVPELQLRSYREAPIGAAWKLTLDRSIGGNVATGVGPSNEVFLGGEDDVVQQAIGLQPTHESVPVVLVQPDGKILGPASIDVAIRAHHELNLLHASVAGRP